MSQQYTLTIYNNSTYSGNVVVYQGKPQSSLPADSIKSLAWLSLGIEPRDGSIINSIEFTWSIDYGFVWSRAGVLLPGVSFKAAGGSPVTSIVPPLKNSIRFKKGERNYTFYDQKNGEPGQLAITTDSSVVAKESSVGVSMSGAGVFAVEARPSFNYWFIPRPSYTVALGSYTQGTVMDISQLSALNPFSFEGGVVDLIFTYNEDGTWTEGPPQSLQLFASSSALLTETRISSGQNKIFPPGIVNNNLTLDNRHNVAGTIQYQIAAQPVVTVPVQPNDDDIIINGVNGQQVRVLNNLPASIYAIY